MFRLGALMKRKQDIVQVSVPLTKGQASDEISHPVTGRRRETWLVPDHLLPRYGGCFERGLIRTMASA